MLSRMMELTEPQEGVLNVAFKLADDEGLALVQPGGLYQTQAAIAAEPAVIHVPRERPPVVIVDEGPLVLVETKRDLAHTVLPFERSMPAEDVAPR